MELDYKELKNSEIYLDVELQFADIYEKINIYNFVLYDYFIVSCTCSLFFKT